MIRASIGKAVIDIAEPMKSAASQTFTSGAKSGKRSIRPQARRAPRVNGVAMPAQETKTALFIRLRMSSRSNSRPIRNM